MWRLTNLAERYVSFSNRSEGLLGGIYAPEGTDWTMASLLATTSGIPFSFPLGENRENEIGEREKFAAGLTTMGDILAKKGYRQEFLCGSDSAFAGRDLYFTQHGNYEIFDLFTAREKGYIPMDYNVFWGFEDRVLYEIAKDEITRLWKTGDRIDFTCRFSLRTVSIGTRTAFAYGPLALARDAEKEGGADLEEEIVLAGGADTLIWRTEEPQRDYGELVRIRVARDGGELLLTDYASCGRKWLDANNRISVWLNVRK
jgi:hypothetical protein